MTVTQKTNKASFMFIYLRGSNDLMSLIDHACTTVILSNSQNGIFAYLSTRIILLNVIYGLVSVLVCEHRLRVQNGLKTQVVANIVT